MIRAHCVVLCLLLCSLLLHGASGRVLAVNDSLADVGVGVSARAVSSAAATYLYPAIYNQLTIISADLPPYCCYDDVEVKHVHLMFQNIAMPDDQIGVTGGVTSSSNGVSVDLDIQFQFLFYLRLCIHDDPFGSGCSTLFGCKGDVTLQVTADVNVTISLAADPNTGLPVMASANPSFTLAVPVMDDLCGEFQKGINDAIPKLNQEVTAKLGPAIDSVLTDFVSTLEQTIPIGEALSLTWMLTSQTGTNDYGIGLMADLNVDPIGGSPPFVPTPPLPPILSFVNGTDDLSFLLSDALLNNLLAAAYDVSDWSISESSNGTSVFVNITQSPVVSFTSLAGANATSITVQGFAKISQGLVRVQMDFSASMSFGISINSTGFLIIQISDELSLTLSNVRPPVPVKPIESAIEAAFAKAIGQLNIKLAEDAPQVPFMGSLASSSVSFSDGYMVIVGSQSAPSAEWRGVAAAIGKGVAVAIVPATALPCPDLSSTGAHQDDCST